MTTDDQTWLAQHFEEHRTHVRAVAYRMLGSLSEADDAVQEAWLRLSRTDADEIENLGGWLTTVVARVSLNMLRSRRRTARSHSASRCPSRSWTVPTGPIPSTRRCSPTRSAWRCSSCSRRCPRPSGSPSVRIDRRAAGGFVRGLESEGAVADQQEAPRGSRPGARQSRRCILRRLRTALGATDASLGDTRVRAARLPRGRSGPRATRRKGGRT